MMEEREKACDDLVLLFGGAAVRIRGPSAGIGAGAAQPTRGKHAAVAMARRALLEDRLRAILDPRATPHWTVAAVLLVAGAVVVSLICIRPSADVADVKGQPVPLVSK